MNITSTRPEQIVHAREVDTRIAALWADYYVVADQISELAKAVSRYSKSERNAPEGRYKVMYAGMVEKAQAQIDELKPSAEERRAAATSVNEAEYTGWNRFFLVQHIHRSMSCSSFRWNTRVGWLPDVSGLTEAEAVAAHGETLCTICFPSAPTELTTKKVDSTICSGSGRGYDTTKVTGRERAYYSPTGTCPECGTTQGLTARGSSRIRKHKKA